MNNQEYNLFKKQVEVLIDRAKTELEASRDVKPIETTSSVIANGKVIKCLVYTEVLGEI